MIAEADLQFLKQAGCSDSIIEHSVAVAEKALEIAAAVSVSVDLSLLKKGAINHDIGRSETHDFDHFIVGAEIAERLGMEEEVVRIIERHIGAGIPKEEASSYGFPKKDYIPETAEEIIVSYADNLIDHITEISIEGAVKKFESHVGKGHPCIKRLLDMHDLVQSWIRDRDSSQVSLGSIT